MVLCLKPRQVRHIICSTTEQGLLQVLEAMESYYRTSNANVHRGAHALSVKATDLYEGARDKVKNFINATRREEIVFTSGATDAINIVAYSWGLNNLKVGARYRWQRQLLRNWSPGCRQAACTRDTDTVVCDAGR